MGSLMEQFPTQETFDTYWSENYVPLEYEDVRAAFDEFVLSAEKHIFLSDYEELGQINRSDFMENLNQNAEFAFQDALTEAFYEKNPELYETAFGLYEEEQMEESSLQVEKKFHEEYSRLYTEFLMELFYTYFAG